MIAPTPEEVRHAEDWHKRQAALRDAERQHRQAVADSGQLRDAEIAAAHRVYKETLDGGTALFEKAKAELAATTDPHPDEQVEFTRASQGIPAAANLLAGKILAEAVPVRDNAVRAAQRQHDRRVAQSATELGL